MDERKGEGGVRGGSKQTNEKEQGRPGVQMCSLTSVPLRLSAATAAAADSAVAPSALGSGSFLFSFLFPRRRGER